MAFLNNQNLYHNPIQMFGFAQMFMLLIFQINTYEKTPFHFIEKGLHKL